MQVLCVALVLVCILALIQQSHIDRLMELKDPNACVTDAGVVVPPPNNAFAVNIRQDETCRKGDGGELTCTPALGTVAVWLDKDGTYGLFSPDGRAHSCWGRSLGPDSENIEQKVESIPHDGRVFYRPDPCDRKYTPLQAGAPLFVMYQLDAGANAMGLSCICGTDKTQCIDPRGDQCADAGFCPEYCDEHRKSYRSHPGPLTE